MFRFYKQTSAHMFPNFVLFSMLSVLEARVHYTFHLSHTQIRLLKPLIDLISISLYHVTSQCLVRYGLAFTFTISGFNAVKRVLNQKVLIAGIEFHFIAMTFRGNLCKC